MAIKSNVLITGACGVTSRSFVRALNQSEYFKDKLNFIGTDICKNLFGIFEGLYEKIYKVPSFNHPRYREIISDIIEKEKIEFAVIIPEPEVLYWSENPFNVKFHKIPAQFAKVAISKLNLYTLLKNTGLVPRFQIMNKYTCEEDIKLIYPVWIRDYSEGSTSGLGSFLAQNFHQLQAWLNINYGNDNFMLSEYLPGRNLACFLLYNNGELIKYGVAERQEYIMAKVSVSKITGNTSKGKLLNYHDAYIIAKKAVDSVIQTTGEAMNGLIVVDLKEDKNGIAKVTEINIRHVAFTSSFAMGGLNFPETQFLIMTEQKELINPEQTIIFPENNIILRDVDGIPIYLEEFKDVEIGNAY